MHFSVSKVDLEVSDTKSANCIISVFTAHYIQFYYVSGIMILNMYSVINYEIIFENNSMFAVRWLERITR